MYGKIKNTKIHNILWLFLYMLPMLFIFSYVLVNTKSGAGVLISAGDFITNMNTLISSILPNNWLMDSFKSILHQLNQNDANFNIIENIVLINCYWFTIVTCIHLALDFILILPNICSKFMEKIGGTE